MPPPLFIRLILFAYFFRFFFHAAALITFRCLLMLATRCRLIFLLRAISPRFATLPLRCCHAATLDDASRR